MQSPLNGPYRSVTVLGVFRLPPVRHVRVLVIVTSFVSLLGLVPPPVWKTLH